MTHEKSTKIEIISILREEEDYTKCNSCKCIEVCKVHEKIADEIYNKIIKQ